MNNTLISVLHKRYEANSLANLYILKFNSEKSNPDEWVASFLSSLTNIKNDHPDILTIKRQEDENDYKVDGNQWKDFQTFIQYKPYQLKNKFVFIHDAHRISEILSNKLLKTFEESPKQLTIFLFLKDQQTLLPTIFSRGISLTILSHHEKGSRNPFYELKTLSKIGEKIKAMGDAEELFINSVTDQILTSTPDYQQIEKLLDDLKKNETYSTFNNSQTSRIALILP
jgi:hypothetical protein